MKFGPKTEQRVETAVEDPKKLEASRLARFARSKAGRFLVPAMLALSNQGCAAFRDTLGAVTFEGGGPTIRAADWKATVGEGALGPGYEIKARPETPGDSQWWNMGEGVYFPEAYTARFERERAGWREVAEVAALEVEMKRSSVILDKKAREQTRADEATKAHTAYIKRWEKAGFIPLDSEDIDATGLRVVRQSLRDHALERFDQGDKIILPPEAPKSMIEFSKTDKLPTEPIALTHFSKDDLQPRAESWVFKTPDGSAIFDPRVNAAWRGIEHMKPILGIEQGVSIRFHEPSSVVRGQSRAEQIEENPARKFQPQGQDNWWTQPDSKKGLTESQRLAVFDPELVVQDIFHHQAEARRNIPTAATWTDAVWSRFLEYASLKVQQRQFVLMHGHDFNPDQAQIKRYRDISTKLQSALTEGRRWLDTHLAGTSQAGQSIDQMADRVIAAARADLALDPSNGHEGLALGISPVSETVTHADAMTMEAELLKDALTMPLEMDETNGQELVMAWSKDESKRSANRSAQLGVVFRTPIARIPGMSEFEHERYVQKAHDLMMQWALMRLVPMVPKNDAMIRLHVVLNQDRTQLAVVGVVDDPAFAPALKQGSETTLY